MGRCLVLDIDRWLRHHDRADDELFGWRDGYFQIAYDNNEMI